MSDLHEHSSTTPAHPEPDPIADPGLEEHHWRPTDVDPKAERRAERQVALMFGLAMVFSVLFVVAYFSLRIGPVTDTFLGLGASQVALGTTLGTALMLIGFGIIQLARKLMGDHEIVEMRHAVKSTDADREETLAILNQGIEEAGIGRRPLVRNSLLGAVGFLGLPAIVLLRDLGPLPQDVNNAAKGEGLYHTLWKKGVRIARDVVGTPIRVTDLEVGDLVNCQPITLFEKDEEGHPIVHGTALQVAKSKASLILLRMEPGDITHGPGRENWTVEGIVAYSKICTHVGCPISLNERTTHHLLCPCHQSTFDLADSGKVVFGPAARALPQLPIMVDSEGYLVAQSDFTEPVGPSFWERDSA